MSSLNSELVLRCQFQGGKRHVLQGLLKTSSVKELKEKIYLITDVPCYSQKILLGFPPRELSIKNDNAQLSSVGVRSGDSLIIENDKRLQPLQTSTPVAKLTRKTVPADNSCLFASISYVILGDTAFSGELRHLIVKTVSDDPVTFNEAFLDKPNQEYCHWISAPERWGGAIEISILSKHYHTEIDIVNTESGRIDRFGEDMNYPSRVFLIYDGIHYDPLGVLSSDGTPLQTVFDSKDETWVSEAEAVGNEARKMKQFTNTNNFTLRCLTCSKPLTGQNAALEHARETAHSNFGEV